MDADWGAPGRSHRGQIATIAKVETARIQLPFGLPVIEIAIVDGRLCLAGHDPELEQVAYSLTDRNTLESDLALVFARINVGKFNVHDVAEVLENTLREFEVTSSHSLIALTAAAHSQDPTIRQAALNNSYLPDHVRRGLESGLGL